MEQLMVTQCGPRIILGKLLPFAIVGILEVAFVIAAALLVFHTPLREAFRCCLAVQYCFFFQRSELVFSFLLFLKLRQQAMMSSFFFFMPAMLLSGFAFPIRNMPPVVQILTCLNPLRYFMQIVRALFLKGTSPARCIRKSLRFSSSELSSSASVRSNSTKSWIKTAGRSQV